MGSCFRADTADVPRRCVLRGPASRSEPATSNAPSQSPSSSMISRACVTHVRGRCVRAFVRRFCFDARDRSRNAQLERGQRRIQRLAALQAFELRADRGGRRRIRLGARAIVGELVRRARPWSRGTCRSCRCRSTSSLLRARSSSDSRMCVVSVSAVKPKVAAPPLIECAARKIAARSSGSGIRDVEHEQQLLHLREQFVGFVEERLIELGDVECHAWFTAEMLSAGALALRLPR